MGKLRTEPLDSVQFRCALCRHEFEAAPRDVEDDPERPWHPFRYSAECPACGEEAEQSPKERGLLKAWAHATGPKTPEGKAASAANLEGHPTPKETLRTRFNAMKHGMHARVANYFPAKPGEYPHCQSCEYFNQGCDQHPRHGHKNPPACLKRMELFLRHQVAFETKDPALLMGLRADTQAALQAIVNDMILAIVGTGVEVRAPEWAVDPQSGTPVIAKYTDPVTGEQRVIEKISAHPLLKPLIDFIQKNNMSLGDLGMTPKVQDDQDTMRGFLQAANAAKEADLVEYQRQQMRQLEQLRGMIERSREHVARDPVLIEHQQQGEG